MSTLLHLRERHKGLITYGKSWQQSRAKAADKSCVALIASVQAVRRTSAASSIALVAAFVVVLLVFLSRQEVFQVSSCQTVQNRLKANVRRLPSHAIRKLRKGGNPFICAHTVCHIQWMYRARHCFEAL